MIDKIEQYLLTLQADICMQLEQVDGSEKFIKDKWSKPDNKGNGLTRVLTNGAVFEQAGLHQGARRRRLHQALHRPRRPEAGVG